VTPELKGTEAFSSASNEGHHDERARSREVLHDAISQLKRLLSRVVDPLILKSFSGECRKAPHIACSPPVRMRSPYLSVLCDLIFQPGLALVGLTNIFEVVVVGAREPEQGLIVSSE
jgi:hypothetical protein